VPASHIDETGFKELLIIGVKIIKVFLIVVYKLYTTSIHP
jgi:hypothetical protein